MSDGEEQLFLELMSDTEGLRIQIAAHDLVDLVEAAAWHGRFYSDVKRDFENGGGARNENEAIVAACAFRIAMHMSQLRHEKHGERDAGKYAKDVGELCMAILQEGNAIHAIYKAGGLRKDEPKGGGDNVVRGPWERGDD